MLKRKQAGRARVSSPDMLMASKIATEHKSKAVSGGHKWSCLCPSCNIARHNHMPLAKVG